MATSPTPNAHAVRRIRNTAVDLHRLADRIERSGGAADADDGSLADRLAELDSARRRLLAELEKLAPVNACLLAKTWR